ncbi:TetR family transcriptional regulator [Actinocorallia longicatena]|uniref:TetR family transcriptional regulator n=1 Tax=Actinocorallia longicatena TaxID=111803 RepID=A0ABP6Q9M6_9ACTN
MRRRPVQRRSQERYERILDAAAHLLDEVGYAALTTKEVARRAEVPIGTFYQFFPDKSVLVHALASRNLDAYLDRLAAVERPETLEGTVEAAVEAFVAMRRTVPGFGVIDFGAGSRAEPMLTELLHVLDPAVDNNTAVALRVRDLFPALAGDLSVRVALECADAVLKLAFRVDPDGDPALIAECKKVLLSYLRA